MNGCHISPSGLIIHHRKLHNFSAPPRACQLATPLELREQLLPADTRRSGSPAAALYSAIQSISTKNATII